MESRKFILMKLSAGQQWKHRHREETYGHGRGRKERVGCTERVTWTLTTCRTANQRGCAGCLRECKLGLCVNLEGGMGRDVARRFGGEETYVHLWLIHVGVWQKPTQFYKAINLQLNKTH